MNLKEKILDFCKNIYQSTLVYRVSSLISLALATFVVYEMKFTSAYDGFIIPCLLLWLFISFLIESFSIKNRKRLIISQSLAFLLSSALAAAIYNSEQWFEYADYWEAFFVKLGASIIIVSIFLSTYINYHHQEKSFSKYCMGLIQNLLQSLVVFILILIGVLAVFGIFDILILSDFGKITEYALIFSAIFIGSVSIMNGYARTKEEVYPFVRNLWLYILFPITLVAMGIVYLYIIKILISLSYPSNEVFRIISILFCASVIVYLPAFELDNSGVLGRWIKRIPFVFAPLIILESYSISIRIYEEALTVWRYAGLSFILIQIIYLFLAIFKNDKQKFILLVIPVIFIISAVFPWVNSFHISYLTQKSRLEKFMEKENLTAEEKLKLNGAYLYLKYDPEGKIYLENNPSEDYEKISDFYEDLNKCFHGRIEGKVMNFDISKYKSLSKVRISFDMNEFYYVLDENTKINLGSELINQALLTRENDDQVQSEFIIQVSNTSYLFIYDLYYDNCDGKISYAHGEALLLEE